ncbi:MAG: hypothetical protein HY683_05470 [Chloroflexi bacterium]|nr:hypothetical protein [Chloroflexota bacterium]
MGRTPPLTVANPSPVKYSLNRVGFAAGAPRLPLVPPDEKSAAQMTRCWPAT